METIGKIRRRHLVNGESICSIARSLNLSRNTVKKYIRESAEQRYSRDYQPAPKLGDHLPLLSKWLAQEVNLPKRARRSAQRLYEDLQREGYQGAYDSVQRFVKAWKQKQHGSVSDAFVPLVFLPGDACQFDWSYEYVELSGVVQQIKVAHFRLSHSRQPFLIAFHRESLEMVMEAHIRAFEFFGGVPLRMIYDNLKTVVTKVLGGKDRKFNTRFMAMANHYLFEPVACTPASGWEKGQVENQVGNLREWLFTPRPKFDSLNDLNKWLHLRCLELGSRPHPMMKESRVTGVFAEEKLHLRCITAEFDGCFEQSCRVSSTCLVSYDRNRYSVPADHAGQQVSLRAYADQDDNSSS